MTVVQIFDQTAPLISGYSMRSKYITDSLTRLGVPLKVVRSPIFTYEDDAQEIDGVRYYCTPIKRWDVIKRIPILKEIWIIRATRRRLSSMLDDDTRLLDAHSSLLNGLAAARIARQRRIPFLYEIRALWEDAAVDQGKTCEGSIRYRLTRRLEMHVISQADRVTVICEGLKRDLIARGVPAHKITVIPNGVDTNRFQPRDPDPELVEQHHLAGHRIIGFIGTFFEFEGLPLLIEAARRVVRQHDRVKFLLVGAGRDAQKVKQMVAGYQLQDRVILTGRVDHAHIARYYSVMEVMVYPRLSRRITELVTPLKPLEAMAMQKVVIGSDVGGMKELVTDRETGLLFRKGDPEDLSNEIIYALEHPDEMDRLRNNAREHVLREREWLTICRGYLRIFEELGIRHRSQADRPG